MLGPWFTPENTNAGRSGISAPTARRTQSVGVPSTWKAPSWRRWGLSGRCRVSEWAVPLCSRSGATTVTFPTSRQASARSAMPGAWMPSSLLTRMFTAGGGGRRRRGGGETGRRGAGGQLETLLQLVLELAERGAGRRPGGLGLELAAPAVLLDPLPGAFDGVLLGVEQVLDEHDQLHFAALVYPVARPVLRRIEEAELALPVPEHVRLEVGQRAPLPDREELLRRPGQSHVHCSGLRVRSMSSAIASRGGLASKSSSPTLAAIGSSTPTRAASRTAARAGLTPSATLRCPAVYASRVSPRASATPRARFRLWPPVAVRIRSPMPASPAKVRASAPRAVPSRAISASPRVMSDLI